MGNARWVGSAALLSLEPIFLIWVDFGHLFAAGTGWLPCPLSLLPWFPRLRLMPHPRIASPGGGSPAVRDSSSMKATRGAWDS